jgi:pyridoxine kinase
MHNHQKKIAVIDDFCGFGRCSLAVSLPIISAMKVQCCPLPTSVFSNHTGFESFYSIDFTPHMPAFIENWKKLDLQFSGILTGYLGSPEQIAIVKDFLAYFKTEKTVAVIDPVMGDYGKLYPSYSPTLAAQMKQLVPFADILTPNLTEAYLLCGEPYRDTAAMTPDAALSEAKRLREKLTVLYGAKQLTLTGIELSDGRIATISYDSTCAAGGEAVHIFRRIEHGYPGTGDLFASVLLGRLLSGMNFHDAADNACRIVAEMIADTAKYDLPRREGLRLEQNLWRICEPQKEHHS